MSVKYIRPQFLDYTICTPGRGDVSRPDMALHRRAMDAERQPVPHLVEQAFLEIAARCGIANDADQVAGRDLSVGQVAHMPEYPSDG